MSAERHAPLILTVMLDTGSQAHFDRLRTRHFPPSLNYLPAHVTVFHNLPGSEREAIEACLAAECGAVTAQPFTVTGLRFLGRGTAYALDMPAVAALRRRLASGWDRWLTPQDRQAWVPHVTVQNKVAPAEARRLHEELRAGFVPHQGRAEGLQLWAYLGGPWQSLGHHLFYQASS